MGADMKTVEIGMNSFEVQDSGECLYAGTEEQCEEYTESLPTEKPKKKPTKKKATKKAE